MAEIVSSIVAKTYATALFETADNEKQAYDMLEQLQDINVLLNENKKFLDILSSVVITKEEKHSILNEVFVSVVQPHVYNFLLILADKNRFDEFNGITADFIQMYNERYDILEVSVTTAIPLSDVLSQKLKSKLERVTNKSVILSCAIDSKILGGVLLSFHNSEIDFTVKSKLDAIGSALKNVVV